MPRRAFNACISDRGKELYFSERNTKSDLVSLTWYFRLGILTWYFARIQKGAFEVHITDRGKELDVYEEIPSLT